MHVCMNVCVSVRLCVRTHVHVCAGMCMCGHVCVCMCACVWLCFHACACTWACLHVWLCVHRHACVCACLHVCGCVCARVHVCVIYLAPWGFGCGPRGRKESDATDRMNHQQRHSLAAPEPRSLLPSGSRPHRTPQVCPLCLLPPPPSPSMPVACIWGHPAEPETSSSEEVLNAYSML